jgi:hypothetical protein
MNRLVELSALDAQYHWAEAEEWLAQASHNEYRAEQLQTLKGRVFTGMAALWRIEDEIGRTIGWAATTIYTPDGIIKVVQIDLATGGRLTDFTEHLHEFEQWAHEHGVDYIEVIGRAGWTRALAPLGFEHNFTSLLKRVYKELH